MVEHDNVHTASNAGFDGFHGRRAAVHGEQERRGKFFQAIFDAVGAKAVAFVHAVGQIKIHLPAKRTQNFDEERGGGHAVHVIIAKDDQRFILFAGAEQSLDGDGHVREQKGVGKVFEARLRENFQWRTVR